MTDIHLRADVRAALMPGFQGTTVPAWLRESLAGDLVAACVYGENVRDRSQVSALGRSLRSARPESLIALDEEGGEVTRLYFDAGSPYPGAAILGRIDDTALTERVGAEVARDALAAGFNLLLAPVADVNSNPDNPVIGTRSFSADPEVAARHVAAWVRGAEGAGALTCVKHFPGHGDTAVDSHLGLPTVTADRSVIEARELVPFRAALAAKSAAVMTSHIVVPAIDADAPATFSHRVLTGVLRGELAFDGLIVSDALDMAGASGEIGIPEAAVRALQAGCDLLTLGPGTTPELMSAVEEAILDAVAEGRLAREFVREAAARVRAAAERGNPEEGRLAVPDPLGAAGVKHSSSDPATAATATLARIADSFAGIETAREWLRAQPNAWIIVVDSVSNDAVGDVPWGPLAAARFPLPDMDGPVADFARRTLRHTSADEPLLAGAPAAIVIGRGLSAGQIAMLRGSGGPMLVVEMGWPRSGWDLATYGSSRLVGAALLEVLNRGAQ